MRSNCAFVASATGARHRRFLRQGQRDAAILGGVRRGEEAGVIAILHVLAIRLQHARAAPVWEKTSRTMARSSPSAAARPSPSASPAVLMFITILTSAFSFAACPARPT